LSFYEGVGVGVLKIEDSESEVLKIEESESELLCTDSTALVKSRRNFEKESVEQKLLRKISVHAQFFRPVKDISPERQKS
jgi:hypothetical protein